MRKTLLPSELRQILQTDAPFDELASRFGITVNAVYQIKNGRWSRDKLAYRRLKKFHRMEAARQAGASWNEIAAAYNFASATSAKVCHMVYRRRSLARMQSDYDAHRLGILGPQSQG